MKLFRYRRPSMNQLLGITRLKRRARWTLGISQFQRLTKPSRIRQRIKYHLGLYSPTARVIRNSAKGKFPTPFGL